MYNQMEPVLTWEMLIVIGEDTPNRTLSAIYFEHSPECVVHESRALWAIVMLGMSTGPMEPETAATNSRYFG